MQPHCSSLSWLPSIPFLLLLTSCSGTHIYPSARLVVQEGQGFLVKLAIDSGFGRVKYCTLLLNSQPYPLHPGNENHVSYVSEWGERVERFTTDECGAKVSNVSLQSSGAWQLGATSRTGVDASAEFQLDVIPAVPSDPEALTVSGRPGDSVVINCTAGEPQRKGAEFFCEMWEERDTRRQRKCRWVPWITGEEEGDSVSHLLRGIHGFSHQAMDCAWPLRAHVL